MGTADSAKTGGHAARSDKPRRWAFRLAAILLGLSPLVAFEGLCWLLDWGRPGLYDDPFVGFRDVRPLFVLNAEKSRYEIPLSRQGYFRPESFPAVKAGNEFRAFCLGGSTVQGRPFAIETSFTTWLELSLQAAEPDRPWDVVNCGGVSYASYRLIPILKEVLGYQPDLIILYTGHNEFLEDRTFDHVKQHGPIVTSALAAASELRTFTLLREGCLRLGGRSSNDPPAGRPILPAEVEALLDYRGGLEEYHWDARWRSDVIAQYRFNLQRMVRMAEAAGVAVVLVNPVSNLRDCPPFKAEHSSHLTPTELAEWESLTTTALDLLNDKVRDLPEAVRLLQRACEIDPQHAGGCYHLAQCYQAAGRTDDARRSFLKAKDLDVCPLRILQPMNEAVLEIARETGTPLLDADALFSREERDGIPGAYWLVDHVHPSVTGHQMIATALAELLVSLGTIHPREGWKAARQQRFDEHLASLDDLYFNQGMDRLNAVRNWARGRARMLRPGQSRPPADAPRSE
ncbi:MAG: tetratricopeptide repeat protein [Planctomycetaceae bacterium]